MISNSAEPANTRTVKAVEIVRPVVTKSLPAKYFPISHQGPLSRFDK